MKKNKYCPQANPTNCKYLNTPSYCAFVREDKKCRKKMKGKYVK